MQNSAISTLHISGCLQIQPNHFPGAIPEDFYTTSHTISECRSEVRMSINEHVMRSSDQHSSLCHPTHFPMQSVLKITRHAKITLKK